MQEMNTVQGQDSPIPESIGRSRASHLAWLLDNQFKLPGTSMRIGLDGLLGLIPGIGDTIAAGLSLLILAEAVQKRVRRRTLLKMAGNIAVDWIVGLVPVLGDVFDIVFKANMRNLALLEEELELRPDEPFRARGVVSECSSPRRQPSSG